MAATVTAGRSHIFYKGQIVTGFSIVTTQLSPYLESSQNCKCTDMGDC